jgi:hypothetical protein
LSIDEAATRLGVSPMTVRRWMGRLHFRQWTEKAWAEVWARVIPKKGWQEVIAGLQAAGLPPETARKRVQRWKSRGLTLDEARRRSAPAKEPRGTCSACEEEQAAGRFYGGKFFCAECLAEKMKVEGVNGL